MVFWCVGTWVGRGMCVGDEGLEAGEIGHAMARAWLMVARVAGL